MAERLFPPPTAAPATPPQKKRRIWRWIGLAAILFVAWLCWQLFGPNPPIIVSRETTYITKPLGPDGLPDYKQYLLDNYHAGVTAENNATVLLWQALGIDSDSASPEDLQAQANELGMQQVPAERDVLSPLFGQANRQAIADWLNNRKNLRNDDGQEITNTDEVIYDVVDEAMEHPWTSMQVPPLADWLRKNQKQIDLLVEASDRERWYWPLETYGNEGARQAFLFPVNSYSLIREAARVLMLRSMWHLGESRTDEAWRDVSAIFRLAHLISQQGILTDELVGIAIQGMAGESFLPLIGNESLSVNQARNFQKELEAQPDFAYMVDSFEKSERVWLLSVLVLSSEGGIGDFLSGLGKGRDLICKPLNFISVDWNVVLSHVNKSYDDIAAASRNPDWNRRQSGFEQLEDELSGFQDRSASPLAWAAALFSERKRSELFAGMVASELICPFTAAKHGEDRANTELTLIRLTAALALYRAEHGEYPESLDALVPEVLLELPVDLYHEKPFIYQRDGAGYLLYSTGPNGQDDGGSNHLMSILAGRDAWDLNEFEQEQFEQQIPADADDIAIRVPPPPFKLPEP
jgi:hypothetical protein